MKYIKVTGWGNNKTHIIPLKAITSLSEEEKYTTIRLDNGTVVNVQESFGVVEELLDLAGATVFEELDIIDKTGGEDAWDVIYSDNDELPF